MIRAPLFPFSCSPGSFHSSPVVKILGFPRGLVRSCWGYRTSPLLHLLLLSPRFPLFSSTADSSTARRDAAPADSTLENSSYCLTPSFEATGQDSNQRRAAVSIPICPCACISFAVANCFSEYPISFGCLERFRNGNNRFRVSEYDVRSTAVSGRVSGFRGRDSLENKFPSSSTASIPFLLDKARADIKQKKKRRVVTRW